MIRIVFICLFLMSHVVAAQEQCNILKAEEYKRIVELRQKVDPLLPKLSAISNFNKPSSIENCYVEFIVYFSSNSEPVARFYLFDPKGGLVNVRVAAGPPRMTCNNSVKNDAMYFEKLLAEKRKFNKSLPPPLVFPKGISVRSFDCLITYTEVFRDDIKKPLLYRQWVFDQNGNIYKFSEINRRSKIYPDDPKIQ